jgi:hypothetical protein
MCLPTACAGVQRLDVLREGVIELRVHLRPAAHAAGFVERDDFECDGGSRWAIGYLTVCAGSGNRHIGQRLYEFSAG